MKFVALLGSPRSNSNSTAIADQLLAAARDGGAETCAFVLNRLDFRGCQGCYACKQGLERCILDDGLTEVLEAVRAADVVVLASPVYYGDITAQLKGFIDRTFSYLVPDYPVNPVPSRLPSGKKLVFVLSQGHPDETMFADIFPRYARFLSWMGFAETRLLRACGIGPASVDAPAEEHLRQAVATARELVGQ